MIRFFFAVWLLLFAAAPSNADCVATNQTSSGPPYAEFDLTNSCRGGARVHWTRRSDQGKSEQGSFYVGGCKITHEQYFPGQYSFTGIEFPQGGDSETCVKLGDSDKRDDPPKQGPSTDLAKRLEAQQKANAATATKAAQQEQEFKKRYEELRKQEQTKRDQAEKESKEAAAKQAEAQREAEAAREAEAERARRAQLERDSYVCVRPSGHSIYYPCERVCGLVNQVRFVQRMQYSQCRDECVYRSHCVKIDPRDRLEILSDSSLRSLQRDGAVPAR